MGSAWSPCCECDVDQSVFWCQLVISFMSAMALMVDSYMVLFNHPCLLYPCAFTIFGSFELLVGQYWLDANDYHDPPLRGVVLKRHIKEALQVYHTVQHLAAPFPCSKGVPC